MLFFMSCFVIFGEKVLHKYEKLIWKAQKSRNKNVLISISEMYAFQNVAFVQETCYNEYRQFERNRRC